MLSDFFQFYLWRPLSCCQNRPHQLSLILNPSHHYFQKKDYYDLTQRGVLLQINWLSLIGYYSKEVQDKVEDLITNNMVRFIGSDCHNMRHVELYKKCQTRRAWHVLHNSGQLLNSTL